MTSGRFAPNPALAAVITRRQGVFSRADVRWSGHSDAEFRQWLRAGHLVQVGRAAFYPEPSVAAGWPSSSQSERDVQITALQARAMLLNLPPQMAASHHTALTLHGLARLHGPVPGELVQVMAMDTSTQTRRQGVITHAMVPGTQLHAGATRVVSVADAIAQVAHTEGVVAAVVAADAALRAQIVEPASLAAACRRLRHTFGRPDIETVAQLADGRAQNTAQTVSRLGATAPELGWPGSTGLPVNGPDPGGGAET